MKKLLWITLLLLMLACSGTLTKPAANLGASVTTVTPSPSLAPPVADLATATASPESCEVTAEALHVRDAPTIEGTVIAWLALGDHLTILPDRSSESAGDWVKVQTAGDITGWINSIYCER